MKEERVDVLKLEGLDGYLDIYPIMSTGAFMIKFKFDTSEQIDVDVHNAEGTAVYTKKLKGVISESSMEINLKGNARGVYMIMIKLNNIFTTKRVFLE